MSLPPELAAKIASARSLRGKPPEQRLVTPATVAETLAQRASTQAGSTYLTYLAEDGVVRSYTYGEFYRRVCRFAAMLQVYAGIQRGERIATAMHNHDDAIAVYCAAWHMGATVVPLNMGEDDKRLSYVLAHSGAKALFVLGEYVERMRVLRKDAPKLEHIIVIEGKAADGEVELGQVLPPVDVPQFQAPDGGGPDDEALIVYTSGTTGVPKGVVLSQYNLIADAYSIAQWHGFTRQTRMMCVLPVHHVNGLVVTHVAPIFFGGSTVLVRKFSPRHFFQCAGAWKIHVASVVPTLLQFLLEATPPEFDSRTAAPELQYLICGAGPLTTELAARFEDRFGIPICHGYGLSETTCYSCFLPPVKSIDGEHRGWIRAHGCPSIGAAVAANEMAIHDENGNAAAEGAKGEIVIRGHNVMLGYHENLKANEGAFTHGWFRSGDEGFFKNGPGGERYYFISGRFKELIIRGGVKISPLEVDEVLNQIPGVKAAMAVGFENTFYGEEVGAYVVKQPDGAVTAESIIAACKARMPFYMTPKAVVFGDTFPVTSTGKYQRNQLKPLFVAHKAVQFREGA